MKKMLFALSALVAGIAMQAQTLNSEGLYVDANGTLFTGTMTKMQQESKVEMTVKNGVAEGPAYYYYPNGKLMETGNFAAGVKDDKWVRYNAMGGVSAIAFYKAGKKTGTWLVYDDKGNK